MTNETVTIQLTSKPLKASLVKAVFLILAGWVCILAAPISPEGEMHGAAILGVLAIPIGSAWYIITKIRIWWNHK